MKREKDIIELPVQEDAIEGAEAYRALHEQRRARRRKRTMRLVICIVVAIAVILAAAFLVKNHLGAKDESEVSFDYVTRGDFETSVSASGSILPDSTVAVTPEVDGIIESVEVEEGDEVEKGDLLVTIRSDEAQKGISDAQKQVDQAQSALGSAQYELSEARKVEEKALDAYNNPKPVEVVEDASDAERAAAEEAQLEADTQAVDDAQASVKAALAGVDAAEADLASANDALAQAQKAADKQRVVAPSDGTIVSLNATVGESTGSGGESGGGGATIATIADLDRMRVRVDVNEMDINRMKVGQKAVVTVTALPDVELAAEVEHIATLPTGSESGMSETGNDGSSVVTYPVDLVIDKPDPQVKPGMSVKVTIITQSLKDVLLAPYATVVDFDDGTGSVTVVDNVVDDAIDGEPQTHDVAINIVASDSSTYVVEGDVSEGDALLVNTGSDEYGDEDMMMGVG